MSPAELDVEAVNLAGRIAVLTDGSSVPVTVMFDSWGDETQDAARCVTFVCGAGDLWFSCRRDDFERQVAN